MRQYIYLSIYIYIYSLFPPGIISSSVMVAESIASSGNGYSFEGGARFGGAIFRMRPSWVRDTTSYVKGAEHREDFRPHGGGSKKVSYKGTRGGRSSDLALPVEHAAGDEPAAARGRRALNLRENWASKATNRGGGYFWWLLWNK